MEHEGDFYKVTVQSVIVWSYPIYLVSLKAILKKNDRLDTLTTPANPVTDSFDLESAPLL